MALDFTTLTTRAECDAATAELDFELKTYTVRAGVGELADDRADRTQASTASQLTRVNARIASADAVLASANIDEETREENTDERAALLVQRTRLLKRNRLTSGTIRFLANVDDEQIADQITTLTTAKNGVATHKATLSA